MTQKSEGSSQECNDFLTYLTFSQLYFGSMGHSGWKPKVVVGPIDKDGGCESIVRGFVSSVKAVQFSEKHILPLFPAKDIMITLLTGEDVGVKFYVKPFVFVWPENSPIKRIEKEDGSKCFHFPEGWAPPTQAPSEATN